MSTFSNAMRICATCTRWAGSRDAGQNIPSYFVWIDDSLGKGQCYGGGFRNLDMLPTATCGKYDKWAMLK